MGLAKIVIDVFLDLGQAPGSAKARMYKVLKEVMEEVQTGKSHEATATWIKSFTIEVSSFVIDADRLFAPKATMSGRVRDKGALELIRKQMQGVADGLPEQLDLKTGRLTSKKMKKERTPAENAMNDIKKMYKKPLVEPLAEHMAH